MKARIVSVISLYAFLNTAPAHSANAFHSLTEELMPPYLSHIHYPAIHMTYSFNHVRDMLKSSAPNLPQAAIDKVLSVLKCAEHTPLADKHLLTLIDYSLPSGEKRLWVFDLYQQKLLFHTYVSHGIKSGVFSSNYFSNLFNSKASSIGVYTTNKSYYGRHGLSLKLNGLDAGFNDNADGRAVVMHGGWYVNEAFIKKYGRAGRSWGCPAIPAELNQAIINTIKEDSILVAYYPSERWFRQSKFLKCESNHANQFATGANQSIREIEDREPIFFAEAQGKKYPRSETEPVIVMPAEAYTQCFQNRPPLTRMLRRQIQHQEYIALTASELQYLVNHPEADQHVYFVIPQIKMVRGYYGTEMLVLNFGKIKAIQESVSNKQQRFTIQFETQAPIEVRASNQFVRWIGL